MLIHKKRNSVEPRLSGQLLQRNVFAALSDQRFVLLLLFFWHFIFTVYKVGAVADPADILQ